MGTDTDHAELVRRARGGDVHAFVALTRRFQHFAFGSALALVHDFHKAEDVVQEAFVAAWSSLPTLADPAAFPGWLRGIVRHHAFRTLRRRQAAALPLAEAANVASEEPASDHQLERRQEAAAALAAIAELPDALREPAVLYFVHECSHQDIAAFLKLSVTTVNNRLHAARSQLKARMLAMVTHTLSAHGLPDDFANRIGRLIAARKQVVEALFDPASPPDILAELALSDEAARRAVSVQVVQRLGGGIVRGVAVAPVDAVPRGATLLSSGRHSATPMNALAFADIVPLLAGPSPAASGTGRILETGIKVIDVMCPVAAEGTLALAGTYGVGLSVVMEELVRRLSGGSDAVSMFVLIPPPSAVWPPSLEENFSHSEAFKKDGFSEGTVGALQTFFFRADADGPWTPERLAALDPIDTVIHLARDRARAKVYPCVDVLTSRSRLIETRAVGEEHAAIAARVRDAIAALWASGGRTERSADKLTLERALKLQNYFTQPFYVAEPYTERPGTTVGLAGALATCRDILDGRHDDLPAEAFFFSGGIDEIRGNVGRLLTFGPVTLAQLDAS